MSIRAAYDSVVGTSNVAKLLRKSPDDVVITMALRSPSCKAKKGGFKDMSPDELMISHFKAIIPRMGIDPALIGDICVGSVNLATPTYVSRSCALAAGIPETVPIQCINRFCSSGLMATSIISNQIRNGEIDIGLAVGFESMSNTPDKAPDGPCAEILAHPVAKDCLMPMGWTSENVSKDFNISRERMDELAALSHQRAGRAQASGRFDDEIVPMVAYQKPSTPAATGAPAAARVEVIVSKDDGIRPDSTAAGLAKIRAAFPQWGNGTTTGGNASQITDGVASSLMMKRSKAEELGLTILGKHVQTSVIGLAPRIMGIGPSLAIPHLLERVGITMDDVDLFEVNEAFASMYAYCIDTFGCPIERTNVNGGGIALGHPVGQTGQRQIATILSEAKKRGAKILVTSMCIGTGQGASSLFVAE